MLVINGHFAERVDDFLNQVVTLLPLFLREGRNILGVKELTRRSMMYGRHNSGSYLDKKRGGKSCEHTLGFRAMDQEHPWKSASTRSWEYKLCILTQLWGAELIHHKGTNVTSRLPTPRNERVFRDAGMSFHPKRQRYQPRIADGKTNKICPVSGTQVAWIVVLSKDRFPAFPQCDQIVVGLASQLFEVDVLDE